MSQQPTIMGPKKYKVPLGKGGLISDWIIIIKKPRKYCPPKQFDAQYFRSFLDKRSNDNTIWVLRSNK